MNSRSTGAVLFRVDASLAMGSGHVMRCLTLADGLRAAGMHCHFVCREHPGCMIEQIAARGFEVTALPAADEREVDQENAPAHAAWLGASWSTDAEQTRAVSMQWQPDWLVVDHYALDHRWESRLRSACRHVMVIDDLADRPHDCDLLLDQNLGRKTSDYQGLVPASCQVLTGPAYALLRPEFAALRNASLARRQTPQLKQILVTMGGVDKDNVTAKVLTALRACALPADCRIMVVMGPHAPWLAQIRAIAAQMPWRTEVLVNISDMARVMAESDLAIGAAGSTSWERCVLGVPALMVVLAENQKNIANALQQEGAAWIWNMADPESFVEIMQDCMGESTRLKEMSNISMRLCDGAGVGVVLNKFNKWNSL